MAFNRHLSNWPRLLGSLHRSNCPWYGMEIAHHWCIAHFSLIQNRPAWIDTVTAFVHLVLKYPLWVLSAYSGLSSWPGVLGLGLRVSALGGVTIFRNLCIYCGIKKVRGIFHYLNSGHFSTLRDNRTRMCFTPVTVSNCQPGDTAWRITTGQ